MAGLICLFFCKPLALAFTQMRWVRLFVIFFILAVALHATSMGNEELVQVVSYVETQFDFFRCVESCALEVTRLVALNAPHKFSVVLSIALFVRGIPNFETASLRMPHHCAQVALYDVSLVALTCFVATLVAFKTEFLVAVEGVMCVFTAEDAVEAPSLVRTLVRHVAELFAVLTLSRWICFLIVARHRFFHSLELI